MRRATRVLVALGAGLAASVAVAMPDTGPVTNRPLPRFVSLNAAEINVRRGPGLDYRLDWVYERRGLPVRVLDEHDNWRLIEDSAGDGGWVYHALISGRRMAEVTAPGVLLQSEPSAEVRTGPCRALVESATRAVACAEGGVLARLTACRREWCRIATSGHDGWVPKSAIWGVTAAEVFGE